MRSTALKWIAPSSPSGSRHSARSSGLMPANRSRSGRSFLSVLAFVSMHMSSSERSSSQRKSASSYWFLRMSCAEKDREHAGAVRTGRRLAVSAYCNQQL
eukprot:GHRQ01028854.1.p1 GENE.GHRQ01028854.1~~GHRQ01028854.1.p1  ORF type:complete len:100 (+),score=2.98 GHRQ01028854.1:44-343(+)